jgi:hypothetical protein
MSDTTNTPQEPPPFPEAPPVVAPAQQSFAKATQAIAAEPAEAPPPGKVLSDEPAWFARRFPVGHPRNAMGPVHWKGWAAMVLYVGMTIGGALAFLLMAIAGLFVTCVILFVVIAFGSLLALLIVSSLKGDETKTIEEYALAKRSGEKHGA